MTFKLQILITCLPGSLILVMYASGKKETNEVSEHMIKWTFSKTSVTIDYLNLGLPEIDKVKNKVDKHLLSV